MRTSADEIKISSRQRSHVKLNFGSMHCRLSNLLYGLNPFAFSCRHVHPSSSQKLSKLPLCAKPIQLNATVCTEMPTMSKFGRFRPATSFLGEHFSALIQILNYRHGLCVLASLIHAFGIKIHHFATQSGISNRNSYSHWVASLCLLDSHYGACGGGPDAKFFARTEAA
jgi:hypothetical protein